MSNGGSLKYWKSAAKCAHRNTRRAPKGPLNRGKWKMDIVERIKSELNSSPVVLFMKGTPDFPQCGFSAQTVAALRACGAQFKHVNIFEEPELREGLKRYSNWPTYPQLYVNGELVGGCDIALEMYKSGDLKKLLDEAHAEA
jgi:monothiol glutaredoxin